MTLQERVEKKFNDLRRKYEQRARADFRHTRAMDYWSFRMRKRWGPEWVAGWTIKEAKMWRKLAKDYDQLLMDMIDVAFEKEKVYFTGTVTFGQFWEQRDALQRGVLQKKHVDSYTKD